jgi:hypothetical protein
VARTPSGASSVDSFSVWHWVLEDAFGDAAYDGSLPGGGEKIGDVISVTST